VIEWARELGCKVERTRKNHFRVTYRGHWVGNVAGTPSSSRSPINDAKRIARNINKLKKETPWRATR
jgi:hypothetical protein